MAEGHPLLDWVDKQLDWARDALRRHAQSPNNELGADDRAAVAARVRLAAGVPHDEELDHVPLQAGHLAFGPIEGPRSLLCSLGPVNNLGRLAADQKLTFALNGITLIYGDNGSGKSGYCRITKKVCRSLTSEELLGNVFEDGVKPPAAALIRYLPDGAKEPIAVPWTDGEPPPEAVRSISVFDSRNARLYVDRENRIGFLPAEISLLERHAAHRREMDAQFEAEKKALEGKCKVPLPVGYLANGEVAKALAKLAPKGREFPTADELNKLGEFAAEDAEELAKLEKALAQDPAALAARCDRSSAAISSYAETIAALEGSLSGDAANALKAKQTSAVMAEKAAAVAAGDQFSGEPLAETGNAPWRLMYEHAKAFVASIGLDELPSKEGDPCALCQQPLGAKAADRLARFAAFVSGEAAKAAASATLALSDAIAELDAFVIPAKGAVDQALAEYRSIDDARSALGAKIADFFAAADARRAALKTAAATGEFGLIPELPDSLSALIVAEVEALGKEAGVLKDQAKLDDKRAEEVARLNELKDRQWLKNSLPTILARLGDLTALARTIECIRLVHNGQLSTQITNIRRALVTAGLDARVKAEIAALDLGYMPFEVSDHSKDGGSYFEVKLKAAADAPPNERVLSEGEQRALALACFLAEVGADNANHGLVFDDPVSSLDHLRIRRVAARLVAEAAKGRQIIVFTHNLLFYNEMMHLAAAASPPIPMARRVVTKTNAGGFGLISDEAEPWTAQKVTARIEGLRLKVKALEGVEDQDTDQYRDAAKDFYSSLRETWERLVEELLLGKVVERYSSEVKTQSLRGVSVTDDDHTTVVFAMKRASEFSGHDQPAGKQLPTPKPDEMKADLKTIDEYRQAIVKRSQQTSDDRKQIEQPPKAIVAS